MSTEAALNWLDEHEDDSIARLMEWLSMPSVGTDPSYDAQTRAAGQWAADHLRASGFDVELRETGTKDEPGHPIVMAHCPGDEEYKGPHVLFYGHYDVQPADPIELWESDPFTPVRKPAEGAVGERIVARGACDDKGQVMMFLEAMRAAFETMGVAGGGVKYTVMLEGEEESGSVNLENFVRDNVDELGTSDVCVISDTGMLGRGRLPLHMGFADWLIQRSPSLGLIRTCILVSGAARFRTRSMNWPRFCRSCGTMIGASRSQVSMTGSVS